MYDESDWEKECGGWAAVAKALFAELSDIYIWDREQSVEDSPAMQKYIEWVKEH